MLSQKLVKWEGVYCLEWPIKYQANPRKKPRFAAMAKKEDSRELIYIFAKLIAVSGSIKEHMNPTDFQRDLSVRKSISSFSAFWTIIPRSFLSPFANRISKTDLDFWGIKP